LRCRFLSEPSLLSRCMYSHKHERAQYTLWIHWITVGSCIAQYVQQKQRNR
jgi:hypothetical protein